MVFLVVSKYLHKLWFLFKGGWNERKDYGRKKAEEKRRKRRKGKHSQEQTDEEENQLR